MEEEIEWITKEHNEWVRLYNRNQLQKYEAAVLRKHKLLRKWNLCIVANSTVILNSVWQLFYAKVEFPYDLIFCVLFGAGFAGGINAIRGLSELQDIEIRKPQVIPEIPTHPESGRSE